MDEEDHYVPRQYQRPRKRHAPPGVHVPNKNEAAVLRRLMSETGLTEVELRQHKKYRVILSTAQKVPPAKRSRYRKIKDRVMKSILSRIDSSKGTSCSR